MSSDVDVDDEQVLPESLQKLEIVPIQSSHTSTNCCKNEQNPFYTVSGIDSGADERNEKLFGPSCSDCGCPNAIVGDVIEGGSSKTSRNSMRNGNNATNNTCPTGGIEHGIQKHIHFKHRDKEKNQIFSERKLMILREPILKLIGRSVYHNHHSHLAASSSSLPTNTDPSTQTHREQKLQATDIASTSMRQNHPVADAIPSTSKQHWQLKREMPTIDFKSLVNDCSNLSLTLDTAATAASRDSNNQLFGAHRMKNSQMLAQSNENSESDPNGINSINNNATVNNNAMSTSMSSNSSNSSTCSQQARMNSSNCDVTIDELASYFETFVHIPKKMSSMAEMMYI